MSADQHQTTIPCRPDHERCAVDGVECECERIEHGKVRRAGDALAAAVEDFLEEVQSDDGDPWSERPTQDIFKPSHPIQQALTAWKAATP